MTATRSARALTLVRGAVIAVLACLGAAGAPALASAAPSGPYAIHSMLQLNSPYAFKEAMFAAAATAGASEIRVDASLGALNNPWIGAALWSGLDDYVRLSQQYSLPVLLDLSGSNDIALETCQPGIDPSTGHCGVGDLNGYYNEVAAVVARTRGVIDDFEIVNEPDGSWAFTGTPQQYAGMLSTAYSAVHDNDPAGRVALGGIMSPNDMSWLATVFTTPGFDAAHAFDIANVHLRDVLTSLPGEVMAWHKFFSYFGDGDLPLWVTETGYPSDPAYQYDAAFRGTDAVSGQAAQAAYLARALPALLFSGAARVFVTERDNLTGQYASEGLLGGQVTDSDENNPTIVPKPAYTVFGELASGITPAQDQPAPSPPAVPAVLAPVAVAPAPAPAPAQAAPEPAPAKKPPATRPAAKKRTSKKPAGPKKPAAKTSASHRKPAPAGRRHAPVHNAPVRHTRRAPHASHRAPARG